MNILTPPDALSGMVEVQLTNGGVLSAPFAVQAQAIAPAFFVIGAGPYIAAEHANGTYLGPPSLYPGVMSPAKPGEIVVLFGNGFGPTSTPVIAGSQVQSGTLATLPAIQIGGVTARVQYGGLIGPGVYQFNVDVPQGTPDGDNAVTALYNGIVTQAGVMLPVAR